MSGHQGEADGTLCRATEHEVSSGTPFKVVIDSCKVFYYVTHNTVSVL